MGTLVVEKFQERSLTLAIVGGYAGWVGELSNLLNADLWEVYIISRNHLDF